MDDEGLDPDALARELDAGETSFVYTIPTFQNPSGRTLSTERRRRVVELAAAHGVPVLEDDPYGLVRYEGEAPPSLYDLEGGDARHLCLLLLEDRCAGPACRLVRRARRASPPGSRRARSPPTSRRRS